MNLSKKQLINIIGILSSELKGEEQKEWVGVLSREMPFDKEDFYVFLEKNCPKLVNFLNNKKIINNILNNLEKWEESGIKIVVLGSEEYPESLRAIYNPPPVLFYKGEWSSLYDFKQTVAIVGSRKANPEQARVAYDLSLRLASSGLCIVSGLALGIDASAHYGAVNSQSVFPTIAVLGNGLDRVYPSSHKFLANKILERGGVILSHFAPGTLPMPYNFLDRNRIISGLSSIVIVAQAAQKSGALSTARYALEQGRELLAIPGPVYDHRFYGSNNLIADGAYVLSGIDDFFKYFPHFLKEERLEDLRVWPENEDEKNIYSYIRENSKVSRNELTRLFSEVDLSLVLINLQVDNYIEALPGDYFKAI